MTAPPLLHLGAQIFAAPGTALMPMLLASEQKKLIYIGSRAGSVASQSIEGGRKGQIICEGARAAPLPPCCRLADLVVCAQIAAPRQR